MNTDPQALVESYLAWFGKLAQGRDLGAGWSEITIPLLDRHNDFLQVYVRQEQGGLKITDDGGTIRRLNQVGCDFKARTKRRSMAETILNSKGVDTAALDSGELETVAVNGDFPHKLHGLLMSMLAVGALANVSPAHIAALFKDDVEGWLIGHRASFRPDATFKGASGNDHTFDFNLTGGGEQPDRIIQTFDKADTLHIESFAYRVLDTRDGYTSEGQQPPNFLALFNGSSGLSQKSERSLMTIGVDPWFWDDRAELAIRMGMVA